MNQPKDMKKLDGTFTLAEVKYNKAEIIYKRSVKLNSKLEEKRRAYSRAQNALDEQKRNLTAEIEAEYKADMPEGFRITLVAFQYSAVLISYSIHEADIHIDGKNQLVTAPVPRPTPSPIDTARNHILNSGAMGTVLKGDFLTKSQKLQLLGLEAEPTKEPTKEADKDE